MVQGELPFLHMEMDEEPTLVSINKTTCFFKANGSLILMYLIYLMLMSVEFCFVRSLKKQAVSQTKV